ncbi:uncharacterized protein KZ484_012463 isoform 1-T4 [Pholidichthys leucotaenia]
MEQEGREQWKRFFVIKTGNTNGAHGSVVERLQTFGQTEVMSRADCDYCLVFCPIVSRVGTDIREALNKIPSDKPVILVVMYHTFNKNYTIIESRRQVTHPNVHLTVDCLFYENRLLKCDRNDIMWRDIERLLGISTLQITWKTILKCCRKHWIVSGILCGTVAFFLLRVLVERVEAGLTIPDWMQWVNREGQ